MLYIHTCACMHHVLLYSFTVMHIVSCTVQYSKTPNFDKPDHNLHVYYSWPTMYIHTCYMHHVYCIHLLPSQLYSPTCSVQPNQWSGLYTLSHDQPTIWQCLYMAHMHWLELRPQDSACGLTATHSSSPTAHTLLKDLVSSPAPAVCTCDCYCAITSQYVVTCVEEGAGLGRTTHTDMHLLVCWWRVGLTHAHPNN